MSDDQIMYLGDVHGDHTIFDRVFANNRGKTIIQVGDLGVLGRKESKESFLRWLRDRCQYYDITLFACRGNHDDPDYFKDTAPADGRITLLADYSVIVLGGRRIGFVGGAVSVDRRQRSGQYYHADEGVVLDKEKLKTLRDLDVLVTHSTIQEHNPYGGTFEGIEGFLKHDTSLKRDLLEEGTVLEEVILTAKKQSPQMYSHIYGHFHKSYCTDFAGMFSRALDIAETCQAFTFSPVQG